MPYIAAYKQHKSARNIKRLDINNRGKNSTGDILISDAKQ
jgi:hypothetical protein